MTLLKHNLRYQPDSARLFARIAQEPWAMFLDSGQPGSQYGRYDILVAAPFMTLVSAGAQTEIQRHGQQVSVSSEDPFALIKQAMQPYSAVPSDMPFTGGAVGYFGYDLARRVEKLPDIASNHDAISTLQIGIYDWAVVVDWLMVM